MARTIRTKVYKFNELSEEAKQKAIDSFRNNDIDYSHYSEEITDSAKAVVELFGLKFGRRYTDIICSHIDDDILNLSGIRLYKYLMNHYYDDLFTPKYIKSVDREIRGKQFVFKVHKDYKGEPYTQIYSKINRVNDGCPLTGVCYDNDILQPVYNFLKKPDNRTFEELIREIESAISKAYDNAEEWVNSDEFIKEEIEANEYEFTKDGKQF
jgi:hypothetical protein